MPHDMPALDSVHRLLSRSGLVTRAAILLRNQCRAIIKYRLMTTHQVEESGEEWFIERVAPLCRTFVDVGANRGSWTAAVLRHGPRIERGFAFEPGARAAAMLRERFADHPQIEIVERALSDHPAAAARFFEEPDAGNTSSLSRLAVGGEAAETTVEVSTLDLEIERHGIDRIDLLKVDAEGHDLAVLRGGERVLREARVRFLQWEYSDVWIAGGATLAAALAYLRELGYQSFLLKRGGLYHFDYERFGEFFTFSNFVSLRADDVPAVAGKVKRLL